MKTVLEIEISTIPEAYIKPEIQIIDIELEQCILAGSGENFGDGGKY